MRYLSKIALTLCTLDTTLDERHGWVIRFQTGDLAPHAAPLGRRTRRRPSRMPVPRLVKGIAKRVVACTGPGLPVLAGERDGLVEVVGLDGICRTVELLLQVLDEAREAPPARLCRRHHPEQIVLLLLGQLSSRNALEQIVRNLNAVKLGKVFSTASGPSTSSATDRALERYTAGNRSAKE